MSTISAWGWQGATGPQGQIGVQGAMGPQGEYGGFGFSRGKCECKCEDNKNEIKELIEKKFDLLLKRFDMVRYAPALK